MLASVSVALLAAPRRTFSIALFTSAISASEVSAVGACTRGACGSASPMPGPRGPIVAVEAGAEVAPGRADGSGTAVFDDVDFLSLDFAAAALRARSS